MTLPLIGMPQGWELILIIFVILLLFGAAKLPELARGTGRALRIFKAETKGLRDDSDTTLTDPTGTTTTARQEPLPPVDPTQPRQP